MQHRVYKCFDKYPVIENKHASQSQVGDILTLIYTSTVANTEVFNCVTVLSFNIAVDLCLLRECSLFLFNDSARIVYGYLLVHCIIFTVPVEGLSCTDSVYAYMFMGSICRVCFFC